MQNIQTVRYRIVLVFVLVGLLAIALWSMPLQAQDTSGGDGTEVTIVITINTSSCLLSPVVEEESESTEVPLATYRPTPTRINQPTADPNAEPTAEPLNVRGAVILTLGEGCEDVIERLSVPSNDVRWFSLTLVDDDVTFIELQTLPDDENPPLLDSRGRYFACGNIEQGDQVCRVGFVLNGTTYIVEIPLTVEGAFFGATFSAPTTDAPAAPAEPTTSSSSNSGGSTSNEPPPPATTQEP